MLVTLPLWPAGTALPNNTRPKVIVAGLVKVRPATTVPVTVKTSSLSLLPRPTEAEVVAELWIVTVPDLLPATAVSRVMVPVAGTVPPAKPPEAKVVVETSPAETTV